MTAGNPPPGRTCWSIAVPKPAPEAGDIDLVRLQVNNATVATSGSRFQYIEIGGKRYSHILRPETGLGADQRIQATLIGSSVRKTNALACALTLSDPDEGRRLIGHFPGPRT